MIVYHRFIPKRYKCLYCGCSPLEIWAFTWIDEYGEEQLSPVLVCNGDHREKGEGYFFDPMEYDLSEDDLVDYVIEDKVVSEPTELCLVTA